MDREVAKVFINVEMCIRDSAYIAKKKRYILHIPLLHVFRRIGIKAVGEAQVGAHKRSVALSKYRDGSRNSIASQFGTRDAIIARSAEDVLMILETGH